MLWQALHDARYLSIPAEEGLGRFWMDKINDDYLAKISERWEPMAKDRWGLVFLEFLPTWL